MKRIVTLLAAVVLAGCATVDPHLAEKQAALHDNVPTCHEAKECEVKWAAARSWVIDNAGMKIQNITDGYIETYGPGDSMNLAVRVEKKPLPDGSYKIEARVWCGNPFGCLRPPVDAALDFERTVNNSYKPT